MAKSRDTLLSFLFIFITLSAPAQRTVPDSGTPRAARNPAQLKEITAEPTIPEDTSRSPIQAGNLFRKAGDFENALRYDQLALIALLGSFTNEDAQRNPLAAHLRNTTDKHAVLGVIRTKADDWFQYARRTANNNTRLQNALNNYMLADSLVDLMRWEQSGPVSKNYWRQMTRSMYERAIETCYLLNNPEKAFHFFEKSRAVALNDQLNELGTGQLPSWEDQKTQTALNSKLHALRTQPAADEEKLRAANQEHERFMRKLERNYPRFYTYMYDNTVADVTAIRRNVLGRNQHLISYFAGDSALYGLVISPDALALKKLDLGKFLSLTVGFQRLIGDREDQNKRFKEYLSIARDMYTTIFKPLDIPLNTRVIVSTDGSFFPFQALSFSKDKPDYLVKNYAFSYAYSGTSLARNMRSKDLNLFAKSFFGLAPVKFDPALKKEPLPNSDLVLKSVGDKFFNAKTLTGPEATRRFFIENSQDYRIVQLLTHATSDKEGNTPVLYFADSTLKLNDLKTGSRSATELLVLSACQTGVGQNQRGEGVFALTRGLAAVGIPSTITSLWYVDNESVQKLTELLYAEFENGLPLDLALKRAQALWLKNASAGEGLPYSWAGMVLVGNADSIETGISRPVGFVILGGVLVLGVFLYYYFKKRKNKKVIR